MGRQTLPHHILAAMRGRPRQNAAESQHHRIKRLQDELRQAQAALKISEERRASIVGAAVFRHVRHDDGFGRRRFCHASRHVDTVGTTGSAFLARPQMPKRLRMSCWDERAKRTMLLISRGYARLAKHAESMEALNPPMIDWRLTSRTDAPRDEGPAFSDRPALRLRPGSVRWAEKRASQRMRTGDGLGIIPPSWRLPQVFAELQKRWRTACVSPQPRGGRRLRDASIGPSDR